VSAEESLIAERYEVLEELGRGGVGRVVLARDTQLNRKVAVKTLLKAGRSEDRARFVEEARINGQLTHPNVVTIHSLGVHRDELYMVMKLVDGRDLKQIRKGLAAGDEAITQEYGLRRLLRLYLQVCEAVGYTHARGVIHRDLKPANVMVTDDDEVLLLDWGLAKPIGEALAEPSGEASFVDDGVIRSRLRGSIAVARSLEVADATSASEADGELTMQGQIVGTPAYMPPEQADSDASLDARSDVYSLGAILYELLAHRAPYTGSTYACLKSLIEGAPQRPSVAAPNNEVPPAVEAIVLKAMARAPQERYPNAAAVAADVAAFLDGGRVGAYQESAGEALRRWVQQNRLAASAALGGFALVNVLILVAAGLVLREEGAAQSARVALEETERESVRLKEQAESLAALAEVAGRGEARVGKALGRVSAFAEATREAFPLFPAERNEARPQTLFQLHEALRREVDELLAAQRALGPEWTRLGGAAADLVALEEPLVEAQRALDRLLVEGLIARRPSLALHVLLLPNPPRVGAGALPTPLPELELGGAESLLRSRALWRAEREPEARDALGEAPSGPPELRAAHLAFRTFVEDLPLTEQRQAFDAALKLNAAAAWLLLRRGTVRAREGDSAGAWGDFERARVLTPLDAWVHGEEARALRPCFADAEMLLKNVRGICKKLSGGEERGGEVAFALAKTWRGQGIGGLLKEYAGSQSPAAWRDAAEIHLLAVRPEAAEREAKRVLEKWPRDRRAQAVLAQVAFDAGDLARSESVVEKGLETSPDDRRLNRLKGRIMVRRDGPSAAALRHLRLGARGAWTSDPWREVAECCLELGELEEGVRAARLALRHDPLASYSYHPRGRPVPGDPRPHRVLGKLRRKQGKLGAAILHHLRASVLWRQSPADRVRKALGRDDRDLIWVGELHEELGLPEEALRHYLEAARDPKLKEAAEKKARRLRGG